MKKTTVIVLTVLIYILNLIMLEGCNKPISVTEEIQNKIDQLPDNSDILEKIKERERLKDIERRINERPQIEDKTKKPKKDN